MTALCAEIEHYKHFNKPWATAIGATMLLLCLWCIGVLRRMLRLEAGVHV